MKLCPDCKRHVRDADARCPFCGCGVPTTTALALAASLGLTAALTGCGPVVDAGSTAGGTGSASAADVSTGTAGTGGSPGTTAVPTTSGPIETTAVDVTAAAASTGGSESSSDGGFIEDSVGSGGVYGLECSGWDQDCAEGEKCVPWANDGGNAWNAMRCVPLVDDPQPVGAPCTMEGSAVSGIDDCGPAAYCFDLDPETLQGTCVAFCEGSENDPMCPDPAQTCVIENEGTITFCLDACDPLGEPCSDDRSCVAVQVGSFVCVRPDVAALGEPCTQFTDCEAGASCRMDEELGNVCTSPCDPAGDDCAVDTTCEPWGDAGLCAPGV